MDWNLIGKLTLAIIKTFVFFGVGALAARLKLLTEEDSDRLGRLTVDILFPFMIISSITENFSAASLLHAWQLPALGFGLIAAGAVLTLPFSRMMRVKTPKRIATFRHLGAVNNYFFLPLIVLGSVFGDLAVAGLILSNIGATIAYWTIGVALLAGNNFRQAVRNICSTNFAATLVALALVAAGWKLPSAMAGICTEVGSISVPLSLILTGALLYHNRRRLFANLYDATFMSVLRLVVLPVILLLLLRLLPLDQLSARVAMTVAVMPASCASVLICQRYGGSPDLAGQSVFITTLASFLTMPALFALFSIG